MSTVWLDELVSVAVSPPELFHMAWTSPGEVPRLRMAQAPAYRMGLRLAWGAFPVLVGFWAQAETVEPSTLMVAAAAALLARAQRTLSTSARHLRRGVLRAELILDDTRWTGIACWTHGRNPLEFMSWTVVAMAVGLVLGAL